MEPSIYSTFKKILIYKMRCQGAKIKKRKEYILFEFPHEDLLIRQKESHITSFYFCKDGRLNEVFRLEGFYGKTIMKKFMQFYEQRQLYLIENDTRI